MAERTEVRLLDPGALAKNKPAGAQQGTEGLRGRVQAGGGERFGGYVAAVGGGVRADPVQSAPYPVMSVIRRFPSVARSWRPVGRPLATSGRGRSIRSRTANSWPYRRRCAPGW